MQVKSRNPGLELYRALLMLGIVAYHVLGQLRPFGRGLENVCDTCVVGFVLISGWFGVRFSWSKAARLVGDWGERL